MKSFCLSFIFVFFFASFFRCFFYLVTGRRTRWRAHDVIRQAGSHSIARFFLFCSAKRLENSFDIGWLAWCIQLVLIIQILCEFSINFSLARIQIFDWFRPSRHQFVVDFVSKTYGCCEFPSHTMYFHPRKLVPGHWKNYFGPCEMSWCRKWSILIL